MAPASKRSGARATAPAAKKAKMDPVTEKVHLVLSALKEDEECEMPAPASCREGLLAAFPHAFGLGAASDERHSYQATVANAVGEILNATEAKWQKRAQAAKDSHAASKAEKAARDAILEEAEGRLNAGHTAVEESNAQVEADAECEREGDKSLKAATAEVDDFDTIQQTKVTERDEYASLMKDVFFVLKAGEWESPEEQNKFERAHLGQLSKMLRKLKIDDSLLSAMGPALKAKPDQRGAFGDMAVSEVEGSINKHIESLDGELNNGEATKALKESAQRDTQVALEAATAKLVASREALQTAENSVVELAAAVKQAKESCGEQAEVISEFDAKVYIDDFGLEKSQSTLKAFGFLRDRVAAAVAETEEAIEEPMAPESAVACA